jgi:cardiolipin synthase A/B
MAPNDTASRAGGRPTIRRALEGCLGIHFTEGNRVERLRNGVQIFPAMLDAIRGAERTIDMLTFIYWTGGIAHEMAGALSDRARAGVRVRLVLDFVGARLMDRDLVASMEDAGVHVHWFRPLESIGDLTDIAERTHRKVLIVDEEIAFTGGVGIAEEWEGDARGPDEWRESHFRLTGPAVDGLRAAFLSDWAESGRFLLDHHDRFPDPIDHDDGTPALVVRGASETGWSDIGVLKRVLCELAEERIRITTAYFSPNEHMTQWLCDAAERGVHVQVLVPGSQTDKRLPQVDGEAAYADLLACGVELFRYEKTMLHAKVLTVDGRIADVGSANFNDRSVRWDEECDIVVIDPDLVDCLDADFDTDLQDAVRVTEEEWAQRGLLQRAQETVASALDRFV